MRSMSLRTPFVVAVLLAPALCVAAEWCSVDGSELAFRTTFEGEALPGKFARFDVSLDLDPANPEGAALEVVVDLRAADMGDEDMNEVLFDVAWLDVARYAEAVYCSDAITEGSPGEYTATGTLRLKGREKSVAVPFTFSQTDASARMRGETVLKRSDFDVGTGEWSTGDSIGLDVAVAFDVRLEHCD